MYVRPYKIKAEQHNFCSSLCRQSWYADVLCQQDAWKESSRKRMLKELNSGVINTVNSKPQKIVDELLYNLNIDFKREYIVDYYSIDNYLIDSNLMIEVQGDYWHCNPNKFKDKINEVQYKGIRKDKSKHTYIKNKYSIEILYLWETDIIKNPELCKMLIDEYVLNNGKLLNYHSFNYSIFENSLKLKSNIKAYQDMDVNDYKHLYKKVS